MPPSTCPSCGYGQDWTVVGIEDGQIRYRCDECDETVLGDNDGPELIHCPGRDCLNWIVVDEGLCSKCKDKEILSGRYAIDEVSDAETS